MDLVDEFAPRGFECVCGNLRMAARAVTRVYDRHLHPAGIRASQMAVLWAVANANGLGVRDLAEYITMDETTMIRNLRGLERRGWVRVEVGADRRSRLPTLTEAGRKVFAAALPRWKEAQKEVATLLQETLVETNRKLLRIARSA
jgi:DNA-binding MarR family transcriptional regulator